MNKSDGQKIAIEFTEKIISNPAAILGYEYRQLHDATVTTLNQYSAYMGDALLQKTFTTDFLTNKMTKNEGQIERYWIKDDHEAIIDRDFWNAVQLEIARRQEYMEKNNLRSMGRYTEYQPFSNRVI